MRDKEKVKAYNAKYRKENKEYIKKLQADYYEKNRERRIQNARNWTVNNREKYLKTRRAYMKTPEGRLTSVKGSAKTRGITFSLTDTEALRILKQPCFYCGDNDKNGIDRVDSKKSYEKNNCVSCCDICNYMKRTYSQGDFIAQCKKICKHHK